MKIVVLDGYTLNPGDLDWGVLDRFGEVTVYNSTKPEEVAARIGDAEIVFTNKSLIDAEILAKCPKVKNIGEMATGQCRCGSRA